MTTVFCGLKGTTTHEKINVLRQHLAGLQCGPLSDSSAVEALLIACWGELAGGSAEGMRADKLYNRMEAASWEPPRLTFTIERHGGTALGSTRAELQQWTVDLNEETATVTTGGHRQLYPSQRKLVRPLVDEVAALISQRQTDPRLKWYSDGHVLVYIGRVLPEIGSPKQTREGRRRRFRRSLDSILLANGWKKRNVNTYDNGSPASGLITTRTVCAFRISAGRTAFFLSLAPARGAKRRMSDTRMDICDIASPRLRV